MPSSTSSSDGRLRWRIFGWCLAALLAYAALIELWQPDITTAPSQWNMNRVRAERYLYTRTPPPAVLVGSSLTFNLPQAELGDGIYNLALAAIGPQTGLAIVQKAGRQPAVVIIETNFILSGVSESLLDDLFAPGVYEVRRPLRGLRYEYQPINVLLSSLRSRAGKSEQDKLQTGAQPEILQRMLAVHHQEFDREPAAAELDTAMAKLSAFTGALEAGGTRIVLLEMPVDPSLANSTLANAIRLRLKQAYPEPRYHWINAGDSAEYATSDGLHLIYRDTVTVARRIRDFVTAPPGTNLQ